MKLNLEALREARNFIQSINAENIEDIEVYHKGELQEDNEELLEIIEEGLSDVDALCLFYSEELKEKTDGK